MSSELTLSILAALLISLLSLVGVFAFFIKEKTIVKISLYLVAFSTGALLGGAFFHLLPEALNLTQNAIQVFIYLMVGLALFFIMERLLHWHHCHDGNCEVHTYTYMSLFGDAIHNFIDGLVIVSAFMASRELGIATTIAVASHEIPQELGDFGILIHGGFSRVKAISWNFFTALTAILGVVIGYFMINSFENITSFLLPFAAGGFIYIAMSDLIPELHKEPKLSKSVVNFVIFGIGILFMLWVKLNFEG